MVSEHLKRRVEERIAECKQLTGIHVDVEIRYNVTGSCGGWARHAPSGCVIRLNADMLVAHGEHFIANTVAHEYAHIAAFEKYGYKIKPHGEEWKRVMRVIGVDPKRCHDYPTPPKRTKQPRVGAVKAPRIGSKLSKCLDLYVSYFDRYDRTTLINIFVLEADCTEQGASTYITACKKLYQAGKY